MEYNFVNCMEKITIYKPIIVNILTYLLLKFYFYVLRVAKIAQGFLYFILSPSVICKLDLSNLPSAICTISY